MNDTNLIDVLRTFPEHFRGPVLRPGGDGYRASRSIFNMRFAQDEPALIAQCLDSADVVTAVRFAADSAIPLAIRSGGHGIDGTAMPDGALVIDTSLMKRIDVDRGAKVARVEAGVVLGELDAGLQKHGMVVPAGTVSTTGVAGLTLGGGVGHLMRRFGATVDSLLGCELVTPEGRQLRASATENPELFWALRGGGHNLGVVTAFEYRAYELGPQVTSGLVVYPWKHSAEVLEAISDYTRTAPRELGVAAALAPCPPFPSVPQEAHGQWVLLLVVVWTGDPARAEGIVGSLATLAQPLANLVGPSPWVETNRMLDPVAPFGHRSHTRGGYLSDLNSEIVSTALSQTETAPTIAEVQPPTVMNFWCLGGAISDDFDEDSAAFSREGASWIWETLGQWDSQEHDEAFVGWVDGALEAIRPHLRPNGYVNFSVDQGPEWLRGLYGSQAKFDRLVAVKRSVDPDNMLRFNKNLLLAAAAD